MEHPPTTWSTSATSVILIILALALTVMSRVKGEEIVLKVESSSNLATWTKVPISENQLRDGELRVTRSQEVKQFFRLRILTPESAALEKIVSYAISDGTDPAVTPTLEDFSDLGVTGVTLWNLTEIHLAIRALDVDEASSKEVLQQVINTFAAQGSLDADAEVYSARANLDSSTAQRVSNFLKDIKGVGIRPTWLVLGKAEFQARLDNIHRSVIGPDGLCVGAPLNNPTGIGFSGTIGQRIEYSNPQRSPSITEFSLWVNASANSDVSTTMALASAYEGNTSRGPELAFGGTVGISPVLNNAAVYVSPTNSSTSNRLSSLPTVVPGLKKLTGMNFTATLIAELNPSPSTRPLYLYKDLHWLNAVNTTPEFYNDGETWTLGARPGGGNELSGEIDFAMATGHPLNPAQQLIFFNSAYRNGIMAAGNPIALIAVGDSMTRGDTGGVNIGLARTAQLMGIQDSGWKGGFYSNNAIGGLPIAGQEELFSSSLNTLDGLEGTLIPFIMFWGGYNSTDPISSSELVRNTLVERYIQMGISARNKGIQTIHWRSLVGGTPLSTETRASRDAFNAYYAQRCAEEGFIWYDHTLTYSNDEFDGEGHNPAYFVDERHLSQIGQQLLVSDFIMRFPNPVNPFQTP